MKMTQKIALLFAASALSLAVSACDDSQPAPTAPDETVIVDDECPRADGEPCR